MIVIRLLRLVWLCPGNKAFDGVESPNLRLVSPRESSTLPIFLVSSMSVTRQSVASRRIIPVLGNMRSGIIDTSWNTPPNTHAHITREAPGIDSEANASRGRWTWGLVGEIAAKKAGAVPGGPVYLQLHMDASTPM